MSARAAKDEKGKPRLEPIPGEAARFYAVLDRHVGKGRLRLVISRVNERRSAAQNRLLWGVYGQIMAALRVQAARGGETCPFRDEEDLHEAMKHLFIGVTVRRYRGEEHEIPPTSTKLDTGQFSRFVNAIAAYWAQREVYVELPEAS